MDTVEVRRANREDCKAIRVLIQELADYENMSNGPKITHETLEKDGFDTEPPLFICYVAVSNEGTIIGYAIAYYTYSTWTGKSLYLEDIYVTPSFRKKQVGSKLFKAIAKEAVESSCTRLNFSVLDWNPARDFYANKGAKDLTDLEGWHVFRVCDEELRALANSL